MSAALVARLDVLGRTGSTNDEMVRRVGSAQGGEADEHAAHWPDLSVIVSQDQTAGRGRLGRSWSAPAGTSLAVSVLLRPAAASDDRAFSANALGWLPLLAGLAVTRAVVRCGPQAHLKWPNDVLIGGKKVCGILCELLPIADGVVVGIGLNVSIAAEDLPVDTATSLLIESVQSSGAQLSADAVLANVLSELIALYRDFVDHDGDPQASGLHQSVTAACDTLDRSVRVQLPDGHDLLGTAVAIDEHGRLVVNTNGRRTAVAAGDVTHVRY